mmetsp:Transcript_16661/g.2721  ORF Transcript_16661/g.2721 Transcript_16661/m.2721 type:complete len:97 (-) Transcript_16661:117-407(-)
MDNRAILPHFRLPISSRDLDKPIKSSHIQPSNVLLIYRHQVTLQPSNMSFVIEFALKNNHKDFLIIVRSHYVQKVTLLLNIPKMSIIGISCGYLFD